MILSLLYRIGRRLALVLPLKFSYRAARFLADLHYHAYKKERNAVMKNLRVILNRQDRADEEELKAITREVFRNFAKYLVDFLRFSEIDVKYIEKNVKIEGMSYLEEALKSGRGVTILSAHLGNWELGGYVLGKLGYPMNAVVLTHKDERVNEFFIEQRGKGNFRSIEIGASLRGCYKVLKNNELLALLGDRNFSSTGFMTGFFGNITPMPKGPAALCVRTGAVMVPCYVVREKDDTFRMIFESPIYPEPCADEERAVEGLIKRYIPSLENIIRKYPHQWYVFVDFWKGS